MECIVRIRSSQNPNDVRIVRLEPDFVWLEIKNALLSELGISPDEDIYFVLLDDNGKVAGPIIVDDRRFWNFYKNKYIEDSNMMFELNFRHKIPPEPVKTADKPVQQVNNPIRSVEPRGDTHPAVHTVSIHAACVTGNTAAVKTMVEGGANLSSRDSTSSTPIHYACIKGHLELVKYILSQKSLVKNYRDGRGRTPLLCAASGGHLDVVQYLVQEKAFTFVVDEDGNSALHLAAMYSHEDVVEWLVNNNVLDTDLMNKDGHTYQQVSTQCEDSLSPANSSGASCGGTLSSVPRPSKKTNTSPVHMVWCRLHGHVDSQCLSLELENMSWDDLCEQVVSAFEVLPNMDDCPDSAALVCHAMLIDEDGDEGSGHIDDMRKFRKLFKKLYRPESGMVFEFHLNQSELLRWTRLSSTAGGASFSNNKSAQGEEKTSVLLRQAAAASGGVTSVLDVAQNAIQAVVSMDDADVVASAAAPPVATTLLSAISSASHIASRPGVKEELFLELELEDNAEVDGGSIGNKSSHSSVSGSASNSAHSNHDALSKGDELILACRRGQSGAVRSLISSGASVNARDATLMTPLHVAAESGQLGICEILINSNCFKNNRDSRGRTPLLCAASGGHLDVVQYLVQEKAFTFVVDEDGNSALHLAAMHSHEDVVEWLTASCDVDAEAHNASGQLYSDLMFHATNSRASHVAHVPSLQQDVDKHSKPMIRPSDEVLHVHMPTSSANPDSYYQSSQSIKETVGELDRPNSYRSGARKAVSSAAPLKAAQAVDRKKNLEREQQALAGHTEAMLAACYSGDFDVAKQLLRSADPNGVHSSSLSALHLTCHLGNADFAESLLKRGASTKMKDRRGFTAMHLACQASHLDVVETLMLYNAPLLPDDQGLTPLHYACISGDEDVIKLLLQYGGDINDIDNAGNSSFHHILESRHTKLALWIAENFEVDYNLLNVNGICPLDVVRNSGYVDLLTSFTEIADATRLSKKRAAAGSRLLDLCARNDWEEALSIVKNGDVDVSLKNASGLYAIHLCAREGEILCVAKLIALGNEVDTTDLTEGRWTPLIYAVRHGHVELARSLIEKGANVNFEDAIGFTPLFHAIQCSDVAAAWLLFEHDADIRYRDWRRNDTVMHVACHENDVATVRWIEDVYEGMTVNSQSKNKSQQTPLDIALMRNCVDVVMYAKENWEEGRRNNSLAFATALKENDIDRAGELVKLGLDPNFFLPDSGEVVFHRACENGNIHIVKALLDQGATLSLQGKDGKMAIHCASSCGQLEIIRWLKKCGCSLNERSGVGMTPIHYACYSGNQEVVRWLIDRGANVQIASADQSTALHFACQSGNKILVKYLLKEINLSPHASNEQGLTPVDFAASEGRVDLVSWLSREMEIPSHEVNELRSKAVAAHKIKMDTLNGIRLRIAAADGDVDEMQSALDEDIDVDIPSEDGKTALHVACAGGDVDVASYLISKGANVNCKTANGLTPLQVACMKGFVDMFHLLVTHGADVMAFDVDGTNILGLACQGPKMTLACLIVKAYPQFNECRKNKLGVSPLQMAARAGNVELVLWLSSNLWITRHQQFLFDACDRGDHKAAQNFISLGLDVNILNEDGSSPLHVACKSSGGAALVQKLLTAGAKACMTDRSARVPLHYAAAKGYAEIVKLLCDADPDTDREDDLGMTPLLYACKNGHMLTVAFLVSHNADVHKTDHKYNTALHYACRSGDLSFVQWLYEGYNLSEDALNAEKKSVIDVAQDEGAVSVVAYLKKKKILRLEELERLREEESAAQAERKVKEIEREKAMIEERARAQAQNKAYAEKIREEESVKLRARKMLASATSTHLVEMAGVGSVDDIIELLACDTDPDSQVGPDETTALHAACTSGHLPVISALLNGGADCNILSKSKETPLFAACVASHWDCALYLIEKGADATIRNVFDVCPLDIICDSGLKDLLEETVETMLKSPGKNFNPDISNSKDISLLHRAAKGGNLDMVKYLIALQANVDCATDDDETPLLMACNGGYFEVAATLLRARADVTLVDRNGKNCLMAAVCGGSQELVNILLKNGSISIDEVDVEGNTALHYACEVDNDDIGRILVDKGGASILIQNVCGETPLKLAEKKKSFKLAKHLKKTQQSVSELLEVCSTGDADWLRVMIAKGVNISRTDSHQVSGLHIAAHQGRTEIISVFIEKGFGLNADDDAGRTPLHYACFGGKLESIKMLVGANADASKKSQIGRSCLHYACQSGNLEIVKYIISHCHPDVNCTSWDKSTPLHDAASANHVQVVSHLVRSGASAHSSTISGANALHLACLNNALDVAKWLVDNCDIDPDSVDGSGQTCFTMACEGGHMEMVRWLYNKGANFMCVGGLYDQLDSALHVASRAGHQQVCEWLLDRGLSPFTVNTSNETSVDVAVNAKRDDLAEWLDDMGHSMISTRVRGVLTHELDRALEGVNSELAFLLFEDIAASYYENTDNCGVSGEYMLQRAAGVGAIDTVKVLLGEYVDVNAACPITKMTPLHYACSRGHGTLVTLLLNHGASLALKDAKGLTAWNIAKMGHYDDILEIMESFMPSISSDPAQALPKDTGESKVVAKMSAPPPPAAPPDVEEPDEKKARSIHESVSAGRLDLVSQCVEELSISVDDTDRHTNRTALHIACELNREDIVQYLITRGASLNRVDARGNTPLHLVCSDKNHNLALLLVRNKADLTIPDNEGDTPLHIICRNGMVGLMEDIIDLPRSILRNLNLDVIDKSGRNLLHVCVEAQALDMASLFIRQGVNINCPDEDMRTPLHYAVLLGQYDIAQSLLIKKADANARDGEGHTPMSLAVIVTKDVNFARLLRDYGADITFTDHEKNNLLHIACADGSVDLAKWLARCRIDPNISNEKGQSAVQLAHLNGHEDLFEWLLAWILSLTVGRHVEEILAEASGVLSVTNESTTNGLDGHDSRTQHVAKYDSDPQLEFEANGYEGKIEASLHGVSRPPPPVRSTSSTRARAAGMENSKGNLASKRHIALL